MTVPWLMNCSHSEDGWCFDCVTKEINSCNEAREQLMDKIIYEVECILDHCRDMQGWRFRSIEKSAKRIEDVLIGKEEDDCPRN